MNITVTNVTDESEDGFLFRVVEFSIDGTIYRNALENGYLDRSALQFGSEILDAVQDAINAFLHDHFIDPELYDIDELIQQAQLVGYRQGKRFVLDQIGETIELMEVSERSRQRVKVFNSRTDCALWLRAELDDKQLERGPVKRVNANIPEALHDDFKALCVRRKVDMQDVLAKLIVKWMQ